MIVNQKKDEILYNIAFLFALLILCAMVSNFFLKNVFKDTYTIITKKKFLNDESLKLKIIVYQGMQSFILFFISSFLFLYSQKRAILNNANIHMKPFNIIFIFFITILLISICEKLKILNYQLTFPLYWKKYEIIARKMNNNIENIINFVSSVKSIKGLVLLIICLSLIPALGEEYFFRSILQKELCRLVNPYLSIFLTSFIFALLHIQIYLMLPRIFFSIVLGYFFYKTNNLFYCFMIHFFNNSFFFLSKFFL